MGADQRDNREAHDLLVGINDRWSDPDYRDRWTQRQTARPKRLPASFHENTKTPIDLKSLTRSRAILKAWDKARSREYDRARGFRRHEVQTRRAEGAKKSAEERRSRQRSRRRVYQSLHRPGQALLGK